MKHCMIDIETLDTSPRAAVLSIGATVFCPETGQLSEKCFYQVIDIGDSIQRGRSIDPQTLAWWQNNHADQLAFTLDHNKRTNEQVQDLFAFWWQSMGLTTPWCKGASFDFAILRDLWGSVPWDYYKEQCMRTALTAIHVADPDWRSSQVTKTPHNALADARLQAACVIEIFAVLKKQSPVEQI